MRLRDIMRVIAPMEDVEVYDVTDDDIHRVLFRGIRFDFSGYIGYETKERGCIANEEVTCVHPAEDRICVCIAGHGGRNLGTFDEREGLRLLRREYETIVRSYDPCLWRNDIGGHVFRREIVADRCFDGRWDDVLAYLRTLDGTTVCGVYECTFDDVLDDVTRAVALVMSAWAYDES